MFRVEVGVSAIFNKTTIDLEDQEHLKTAFNMVTLVTSD